MAVAGQSRAPNLEQCINDINEQLASEFRGRYTKEEIQRVAQETFTHLEDAKIKDFVPLFVARETRARLLNTLNASA